MTKTIELPIRITPGAALISARVVEEDGQVVVRMGLVVQFHVNNGPLESRQVDARLVLGDAAPANG